MEDHHERVGKFQVVLLALSIYVLAALSVEVTIPLSASARHALDSTDTLICLVFLTDFFLSLYRAPKRLSFFLRGGWIDLISSIPAWHVFRWGRLFRIIRILRSLRAVHILFNFLFAKRSRGAFVTVVTGCGILIAFASVTVLHLETSPDSNIKSVSDALWWSAVTVTTVGYGDKFPVTPEGRILGVLLMTAGVALYGVFTGFIASWFSEQETAQKDHSLATMQLQLAEIQQDLADMKAQLQNAAPAKG